MKIKNKSENIFFDKPYFVYLIKSFIKIKFLYILLAIYAILIVATVWIIPTILKINQIELITHTIILILYVMATAFIGSFLSIHLFRTSIDDGTEILICSKPITRREIVFVKSISFILIALFLSFVSSLFSLTIYLNKNKGEMNDAYIVLGIFIGTFISCIFFGSVAGCFSLFYSKTKTILLSVFFILIISFISIASMFVMPNPIKMIGNNKEIYDIGNSRILDKDKNTNRLKIKTGNYHVLKTTDQWSIFPDDEEYIYIYNMTLPEYIDSIYKKVNSSFFLNYLDIGKQLASIFTFVKLSNYINSSLNVGKIYSPPFKYKFNKKSSNDIYESNFVTRNLNFFKIDNNDILTDEETKIVNDAFNIGLLQPNLEAHMSHFRLSDKLTTISNKINYNVTYFENLDVDESLWERFLNEKGKIYIDYMEYVLTKIDGERYQHNKALDVFIKVLLGYEIKTNLDGKKELIYKKNNHFMDFKFKDESKPKLSEMYYIENTIQKLSISALMYYSKYQLVEQYSYDKHNFLLDKNNIDLSYFDFMDTMVWDTTITFKYFFSSFDQFQHKFHNAWMYLEKYIKGIWPSYHIDEKIYNFFQFLKKSPNQEHKDLYNKFIIPKNKIRDSTIKKLYLELFNIKFKPISFLFEDNALTEFIINKYINNILQGSYLWSQGTLIMDSNEWEYALINNFILRPTSFFDKFEKIHLDYVYNRWILISSWLLISLSMFTIFAILYERKDFK